MYRYLAEACILIGRYWGFHGSKEAKPISPVIQKGYTNFHSPEQDTMVRLVKGYGIV